VDQTEYETAAACMVAAGELTREYQDELLGRVGAVFARREPRLQAGKYVRALIAEVPRKNGWQIAEWVGDATPDTRPFRDRGSCRSCDRLGLRYPGVTRLG
jgi:hypothetical protein